MRKLIKNLLVYNPERRLPWSRLFFGSFAKECYSVAEIHLDKIDEVVDLKLEDEDNSFKWLTE